MCIPYSLSCLISLFTEFHHYSCCGSDVECTTLYLVPILLLIVIPIMKTSRVAEKQMAGVAVAKIIVSVSHHLM